MGWRCGELGNCEVLQHILRETRSSVLVHLNADGKGLILLPGKVAWSRQSMVGASAWWWVGTLQAQPLGLWACRMEVQHWELNRVVVLMDSLCSVISHNPSAPVTSSIRTWHGRTQRAGGQRFSMNTSRFGYFFCWQGHCSSGFALVSICKEPKDKGYSIEFLRTTFQQPAWELCEEEIPHQVNLFLGS